VHERDLVLRLGTCVCTYRGGEGGEGGSRAHPPEGAGFVPLVRCLPVPSRKIC
jgi:hypothetical protein